RTEIESFRSIAFKIERTETEKSVVKIAVITGSAPDSVLGRSHTAVVSVAVPKTAGVRRKFVLVSGLCRTDPGRQSGCPRIARSIAKSNVRIAFPTVGDPEIATLAEELRHRF